LGDPTGLEEGAPGLGLGMMGSLVQVEDGGHAGLGIMEDSLPVLSVFIGEERLQPLAHSGPLGRVVLDAEIRILAFLLAQAPACPLARPRFAATPDRLLVQVRCAAPADLQAACGYPAGRCPHHGSYTGPDDAKEELDICLLRQALRFR